MPKNLVNLEQLIGYKFQNLALLERAVTHRSWAFEQVAMGEDEAARSLQNESLEFVGDSVLGLAVAEQLYNLHPKASEGDLTLMKHSLVSTTTLAKVSKAICLGDYLRVGRGEEKTGGRRKQALLADTLEAIIAAIFFDSGYIPARAFVARIYAEELRNATPKTSIDYKTLLQETLQAEKLAAPCYSVIGTEGPPHERQFLVEAVWENGAVQATGSSIKSAEMTAANLVLKQLGKAKPKKIKHHDSEERNTTKCEIDSQISE
ncbi:MAG: ribonuclease III [Pyrinomonadaceae bacterium]|nr:ribonuclease III [Pyrinomonadaceae bacterium]